MLARQIYSEYTSVVHISLTLLCQYVLHISFISIIIPFLCSCLSFVLDINESSISDYSALVYVISYFSSFCLICYVNSFIADIMRWRILMHISGITCMDTHNLRGLLKRFVLRPLSKSTGNRDRTQKRFIFSLSFSSFSESL